MTAGEIALARSVFSNSIDYDRVRIHDGRIFPGFIQKKDRAMAGRNKISFPGGSHCADFSQGEPRIQSLFIHELAHVWQHQNKIVNTYVAFAREMIRHKFNYNACYAYKLEEGRQLKFYNFEQQATIIQDWFLLKHHGDDFSHRDSRKNAEKGDALQKLYESVLKGFPSGDPCRLRHFKARL